MFGGTCGGKATTTTDVGTPSGFDGSVKTESRKPSAASTEDDDDAEDEEAAAAGRRSAVVEEAEGSSSCGVVAADFAWGRRRRGERYGGRAAAVQ